MAWGTFRFYAITTGEERPAFEWSTSDPRTWTYLSYMFTGMLLCIGTCCTAARMRWKLFETLDWELIIFSLAAFTMLALWLANPWVMCSILGRDPFEVWGGDPRAYLPSSRNWMTAILLQASICSLRTHFFVWLGVLFVILLTLTQIVLPEPFPGDGFRADSISALYIFGFAFVGSWWREKREREDWLRVRALVECVEEATTKIAITEKIVDNYEAELTVVTQDLCNATKTVQDKDCQLKSRLAEISKMEANIAQLKKEVDELEDEARSTVLPLPTQQVGISPVSFPERSNSLGQQLIGKINGLWIVSSGLRFCAAFALPLPPSSLALVMP
eukprot:TRINITY_DN27462_c0_g2_i2.p1 TRINITY_DN27462_c0_g2~~TRINITY_DN27462_c0_g2_i2.p1  ORF type:complete len:356 (-),score=41.04 TRINITY_DN27462_c0_g2_i2:76-1068(-)